MTHPASGASARGKYYDGRFGASHDVIIDIEPDGLYIHSLDSRIQEHWPFPDIVVHDAPAPPVPARLSLFNLPETRLFIRADEGWDALSAALPKSAYGGLRIPIEWTHILGYAVLSAVLLGGLLLGAPKLLEYAAYSVPEEIEKQIGSYAASSISTAPLCQDDAGAQALQDLLQTLQAGAQKAGYARGVSYDLRVVYDDDTLNALAAPGGYLILFSGAINAAQSPDEIAGILAHEMAHVELNHPLRGIMRDIGMSAALQMMFGSDSIGSSALQIAGILGQMRHSRESESEADRVGYDILLHAGLDPKSLTLFLSRLPHLPHTGGEAGIMTYLSTHPHTKDRIDEIRT